jgi:hypothetical protein
MLITQKKKEKKKMASYRFDKSLLDEFRELCKQNNLVQVQILENAMKKAIEEMKELKTEVKEDDR